jgi:hypothetical protein
MPSDDVYVNLVTETKKSVASLAKYAVAITAAMMAVKKGLAIIKEMQEAYFVQERAETKLKNALMATGNAVGISFTEMKRFAGGMQEATGIGDELILSAQGLMTTFTQVGKEIFPDAIKAAADMSVMFGQDLQQSVIQLGTALNDPIAGVGRLRKIGISFTEDQTDSIKKFMDQNDVMGAQAVILDELRVEFGGVAEAMGDTAAGSADKMRAAWGGLAEEGGKLVNIVLQPMREKLTTLVTGFGDWLAMITATKEELDNFGNVDLLGLVDPTSARKNKLSEDIAQLTKELDLYKLAVIAGTAPALFFGDVLMGGDIAVERLAKDISVLQTELEDLDAVTRTMTEDEIAQAEAVAKLKSEFAFIDKQALKWGDSIDAVAEKNAFFGSVMSELAGKDFRVYGNALQRIAALFKDELTPAMEEYQKAGGGMIPAPGVSARPTKGSGIRNLAAYAKGDPTERWQEAEAERVEKLTDLYEEYGKTLTNVFEQLGADIVKGENAWASFARAGLGAIAAVIEAFAAAEVAKAAAAFVKLDIAGGISSTIAAAGLSLAAGGIKNIPIMDNGGIVSSPTLALLAANGQPEQVTPLGRGGGGSNVTVHVYGTVQSENQLAGFVASVMGRSRRGY